MAATDPTITSLGSNLEINSVATIPEFMPQSSINDVNPSEALSLGWSWFDEPVGISSENAFTELGLLEQINTSDQSDYLWYSLSSGMPSVEPFLQDGSQTVLHVESLGHALQNYRSGKGKVALEIPVTLGPGKNTIDLLSLTVGLQNYGALFEKAGAGITGPLQLKAENNGSTVDLSSPHWTYQIGLKGEELGLPSGGSSGWVSESTLPKKQPLIWYKRNFDAPSGNNPIAIGFMGMGKGEAWVNGQSIGRYRPNYTSSSAGCTSSCNYRGSYSSNKCLKNCGKPSQQLYHVPRSWVKPSGMVLFLGGFVFLLEGTSWKVHVNLSCFVEHLREENLWIPASCLLHVRKKPP